MIASLFILLAANPLGSASDLGLPQVTAESGLSSVLNIVFTLAGLIAVIFVIVGGIKYVLSGGDSAGIKSAKETIIYAVVGLIVTLLAFGIVNYVTHIKG